MPESWKLYPPAARTDIISLERRFDRQLGRDTRTILCGAVAEAPPDFVLRINNQTAPHWEQRAAHASFAAARALLARYATRQRLHAARVRLGETLDAVASRLDDGRPFLFGEQLTGADITFAALSAPVFAPRDYGVPLPERGAFPPALRQLFDEYAKHPAIIFARRLYERERTRTVPL
jgi:glutathione S-transferase